MDKKFLKEKNLYEAHKQFMRLCEWSYVPTTLEEEGEEDMPQDGAEGGAPMDGGMPQDGAEGGAPMNGDPMGNGAEGDMPSMDGGMSQDGAEDGAPMGGDPIGNGAEGDTPPMDGGMPPIGGGSMSDGEDETVIDVDDITNAQEKMNDKVNVVGQDLGKVDSKIEALLQTLSKMETMINNNNEEIAKFKAEFEKRNPTQTEKLNLRSLDSYPFNVNPKDYWAQKGADPNSNYSGFSNNGEPTTQEYVITNNDVDDFSEREMEDSFDIADELRQDINKIFGI